MPKVTFNEEWCKGCKLCISACPKGIIKVNTEKLNSKGFYPVAVTDIDKCIGCAFCAIICPDCIISVEK